MQTIKSMATVPGIESREAILNLDLEAINARKDKIVRRIYVAGMIGQKVLTVIGCLMMTVMYALNVRSSTSVFETCCWSVWYLVDFVMAFGFCGDYILFPCMWILIALNYRLDLISFLIEIVQMIQNQRTKVLQRRSHYSIAVTSIIKSYNHLRIQANTVNEMLAPILLVMILITTPYFCLMFYITVNTEVLVLQLIFSLATANTVIFASALLALAANVTSNSEALHEKLCSAFARLSASPHVKAEQRLLMLMMLEHMTSDDKAMALTSPDGQKYTSYSLTSYVIEMGLLYLLLITLNRQSLF